MLARLDIRTVIPGHGEPFGEVTAALERAFDRTAAFEADTLRVARHALKAVFTFALLDKQRFPAAELPAYIDRIDMYRAFNQRFFRLPAAALAKLLLEELERVGAVRREDGWLRPA
jgi:hypothetical protein